MTTLPVKYHQAVAIDAQAFARDWIVFNREPQGYLHPEFSCKSLMRAWALHHPLGMEDVVFFADNGEPEADQVLQDLIAERVDRNEPLGAFLGVYNVRSRNRSRNKKPGPTKLNNFRRDLVFCLLIYDLKKRFNLAVHYNPASHRPTASTIAAEALTEAGLGPISHRGLRKIWDRYGPIITAGIQEGFRGFA
jgi:hypothetical protein